MLVVGCETAIQPGIQEAVLDSSILPSGFRQLREDTLRATGHGPRQHVVTGPVDAYRSEGIRLPQGYRLVETYRRDGVRSERWDGPAVTADDWRCRVVIETPRPLPTSGDLSVRLVSTCWKPRDHPESISDPSRPG